MKLQSIITTALATCLALDGALAENKRPNIVVILSDDAGFEEFGLYKVKKGVPSNNPKRKAAHHRLPLSYKFYDPAF